VVDTAHKVRNANINWSEGLDNLDAAEERIARIWRGYLSLPHENVENNLIADIRPLMNVADREIANLRDIFERQDMDALTEFTIVDLYPAIDPVSGKFSDLVQTQIDLAQAIYEQSEADINRTLIIMIVVIIAGVLILALIAARIVNSITRPIDLAAEQCERIAAGDLTATMEIRNQDEIGHLMESLNNMAAQLRTVVSDVRNRSGTILTAANEIASGNLDLSQRTEQQAANLEETASSMEEMTATVRQNADNARHASKLAESARNEAERGAEVVSGAMGAMNEINASSRKIADITSVVDEIAFQTNLLALNAAVEAARAGEAGRGFAVVATEVRVLAQRSAEAAKQIKDLIDDSVGKVADGSRLVENSASTLTGIVDSIKKVSDIVSEITASSEEQSDGIQQVNMAVSQMDQGTQQNAALVEQSAAAAKSLDDQARAMDEQMSFFNVGDVAPVTSRQSAALSGHGSRRAAPVVTPSLAKPAARKATPAPTPVDDDSEWDEF